MHTPPCIGVRKSKQRVQPASRVTRSATIYRFTDLKQKLGANRVPFLLPSEAWYKILSLSRGGQSDGTPGPRSKERAGRKSSKSKQPGFIARERKTGKRLPLIASLRFVSLLFALFVSRLRKRLFASIRRARQDTFSTTASDVQPRHE